MKKIKDFFIDVQKEMKKVKWPSKKEMVTYSVATITFIVIFGTFFASLDLIITGIKLVVK